MQERLKARKIQQRIVAQDACELVRIIRIGFSSLGTRLGADCGVVQQLAQSGSAYVEKECPTSRRFRRKVGKK